MGTFPSTRLPVAYEVVQLESSIQQGWPILGSDEIKLLGELNVSYRKSLQKVMWNRNGEIHRGS